LSRYTGTGLVSINRASKNVCIFGNNTSEAAANTKYDVGNIPINTTADCARREDATAAAPSSGTWKPGDRWYDADPGAGARMGAIVTTGGSYSSLGGITCYATNGSPDCTNLSGTTNLSVGTYVSHPGFSGTVRVDSFPSATTTRLSANAATTTGGQTMAVANPTFKDMPDLDP